MHRITPLVRDILIENSYAEGTCGVLLSSGVDSNSVLAALIRRGIKPVIYSFHIPNRYSTDFRYAQRTADKLGLEFTEVVILQDIETIIEQVRWAIHDLGFRKKADIECSIPVRNVIDVAHAAGVQNLFTGAYGDHYFGTSRKCQVRAHTGNGMDDPVWLNEYRDAVFGSPKPGQTVRLREYAERYGIKIYAPYHDPRLVEAFRNTTWREINKPKQKQVIREAFPEIERWGVGRTNQPLQLGDTGIALAYEKLLETSLNKRGYKRVIGIYNEIAREKPNA